MSRLEKEVLNIEAREEEKMQLTGVQFPKETFEMRNFTHSTLDDDASKEFKDAKWVVLTTPIIQK